MKSMQLPHRISGFRFIDTCLFATLIEMAKRKNGHHKCKLNSLNVECAWCMRYAWATRLTFSVFCLCVQYNARQKGIQKKSEYSVWKYDKNRKVQKPVAVKQHAISHRITPFGLLIVGRTVCCVVLFFILLLSGTKNFMQRKKMLLRENNLFHFNLSIFTTLQWFLYGIFSLFNFFCFFIFLVSFLFFFRRE